MRDERLAGGVDPSGGHYAYRERTGAGSARGCRFVATMSGFRGAGADFVGECVLPLEVAVGDDDAPAATRGVVSGIHARHTVAPSAASKRVPLKPPHIGGRSHHIPRRLALLAAVAALALAYAALTSRRVGPVLVCGENDETPRASAVQTVCLGEHIVLKSERQDVSLYKRITQYYTDTRWEMLYNDVPIVQALHRRVDSQTGLRYVEMKRAVLDLNATPDRKWNAAQLRAFNDRLIANNHLALDLRKERNVFLQPNGRIALVDFNLYPSWTRPLVMRFDPFSKPIPGYSNLFGDIDVAELYA